MRKFAWRRVDFCVHVKFLSLPGCLAGISMERPTCWPKEIVYKPRKKQSKICPTSERSTEWEMKCSRAVTSYGRPVAAVNGNKACSLTSWMHQWRHITERLWKRTRPLYTVANNDWFQSFRTLDFWRQFSFDHLERTLVLLLRMVSFQGSKDHRSINLIFAHSHDRIRSSEHLRTSEQNSYFSEKLKIWSSPGMKDKQLLGVSLNVRRTERKKIWHCPDE